MTIKIDSTHCTPNSQSYDEKTWQRIQIDDEESTVEKQGKLFIYEQCLQNLFALEKRLAVAAMQADEIEIKALCDIRSYSFGTIELSSQLQPYFKVSKKYNIRCKAVLDFLDLYFEVNADTNRHKIKEFLTKRTGTEFYIEEAGIGYTIRIHDIKSMKQLNKIVEQLEHYHLNASSLKIVEIELALDFYNAPLPFLIALLKAARLEQNSGNIRLFKRCTSNIPTSPLTNLAYLKQGYNIGINDKTAHIYIHGYFKTIDNDRSLPVCDHRVRWEVNLKKSELEKMNNNKSNLKQIINEGSKYLRFAKLSDKAHPNFKLEYRDSVKPFGLEQKTYSKNRNIRSLRDGVEQYKELNQVVKDAAKNLTRNF